MFKSITITLIPFALLASGIAATADLHDPTRPDTTITAPVSAPVTRFSVSAIFVSDARRVAIVNGKTVSAGDRVGGATVRAINAQSVKLHYQNKIVHARLSSAKVRE